MTRDDLSMTDTGGGVSKVQFPDSGRLTDDVMVVCARSDKVPQKVKDVTRHASHLPGCVC